MNFVFRYTQYRFATSYVPHLTSSCGMCHSYVFYSYNNTGCHQKTSHLSLFQNLSSGAALLHRNGADQDEKLRKFGKLLLNK